MSQPCRLTRAAAGAEARSLIDRSVTLGFTFNGRPYQGHPGDTLASALLANGVHLVARSFKYHRPRGIVAAGVEEPNAMVQLDTGARTVPNLKATEVPLYEGLCAASVNVFPSLRFDAGAAVGALSRFMPAGFYYKTFFGSRRLWQHLFEPIIRRAGGWGRAPTTPDPDYYDRMHLHCDVLVVGGGAAGLAAARAAAGGGARVVLADEGRTFGGALLGRQTTIDGRPGREWVDEAVAGLAERDEVTLLPRTTVFGYYDGNYLAAVERRCEAGEASSQRLSRERLWHFRARRVILATGAHERPVVFANNDRPGVMLAGAVQSYINRFEVLPGRRAVLFTNNDRAYESALAILSSGGELAAIVDSRSDPGGPLVEAVLEKGVVVKAGYAVVDTRGRGRVNRVAIAPIDGKGTPGGAAEWVRCDLLAVSGGFSPVVHLHCQAQGRLDFDETSCCFRPAAAARASGERRSVGACNGMFALREALAGGTDAGFAAARDCGFDSPAGEVPRTDEAHAGPPMPLWSVGDGKRGAAGRKHFVDLQNDTTAADIRLAVKEGFESVEHMKRYTLAGFGTDQGKTSNINALAILAGTVGEPIPAVGTTTFRPPYTPVTLGAMGGRDRGALFDPARLTALHGRHLALGAEFEDVGQWKRPWYYPRAGEDMHAAVARECLAVRERVGVLDASTLGKIDIQGPDAAEFLNRVYTNNWLKLPVGRIRYGVMCRDDGMVFDDGTTARLDEHRYHMTTTTGNAAAVLDHLEEQLQTEWRDLRVRLTSVTEQWATVGVAGPCSRRVMQKLLPDMDLSATAFPFLTWREATLGKAPLRIFRISFTGELQYEINVPWHYGAALWDAVMEAGAEFDIVPYGTETMHVLRAEKGFIIIGQETDGTQTPQDLGLDWAVSDRKDFIGRRSLSRPDCLRPDRKQLVGLLPESGESGTAMESGELGGELGTAMISGELGTAMISAGAPGDGKLGTAIIPEGTQLVACGHSQDAPPVPMQGFITSSYFSPALGRRICLALVRGGKARHGEVLEAAIAGKPVRVRLCEPVFYDPEGSRRDGL